VILLLLGGCAPELAERGLARPNFPAFAPGNVKESEILQKYGQPYSSGQFTLNGQVIRFLHYAHIAPTESNVRVKYMKRCRFFFLGDQYLGYSFGTGFPDEQINVDEKLVPNIIKGKTGRDEVIALFGTPSAVLKYPATPENATVDGDSLVDYAYHMFSSTDPGWFEHKALRVVFDANEIAKDVVFSTSKRNATKGASSLLGD
jgi:hypothetical protein